MTRVDAKQIGSFKPSVGLTDGENVFILIARCLKMADAAGWTDQQKTEFGKQITDSESYAAAKQVMETHFDVRWEDGDDD